MRELTVVTPTFYPEPIGTPLYVTDLCRWFSDQGWSVRVITAQPFYPQFRRYPGFGRATRRSVIDSIEVLRLPTVVPRGGSRSWRVASDLNFVFQGLLRARRYRSRSVLSVSPGAPWTAVVAAAAAARSARHVCLVHDIQTGLVSRAGAPGWLRRSLRINERRSLESADVVATLSTDMMAELGAMGVRRPLEVLPLWATVARRSDFGSSPREVQYSGNFGEKQGVEALPEIAAGLARHGISLRVRGAGPRFEALLPELRRASDGTVIVEDLVPAAQLADALAQSPIHLVLQAPDTSAFVMPSKVLNALACGATVVAMANAGTSVNRLAEGTEGLHVVPPQRPELVIEGVVRLIDAACEPATRRRIAAAAQASFARDTVLGRLEQMLQDPQSHGSADVAP